MSAPVILPMLIVLLRMRIVQGDSLELAWLGRKKLLTGRKGITVALLAAVVLNAAIVLATIWTAYSYRYSAFVDPVAGRDTLAGAIPLDKPGLLYDAARFQTRHHLLPEAYFCGAVM